MNPPRQDGLSLAKLSLKERPVALEKFDFLSLPDELLESIATRLQEVQQLGSLANLGFCSKRLRDVCNPVLWKDLTWTENMWSSYAKKSNPPREWEYVEYISFQGATTCFWEGLHNDLRPEELDSSWEDVLLNRWPRLKAVIEKRRRPPFTIQCPVHAVWISPKNTLLKRSRSVDENSISRITKVLYGNTLSVSKSARDQLGIAIPRFSTAHQLAPVGTTEQPKAPMGHRSGSNPSRRTLPSELERDAYLSDALLLGLDIHLISDPPGEKKMAMVGKGQWLYALCRLSMETLDTPKLSLHLECCSSVEIFLWMVLIHIATTGSECSPSTLYVNLPAYGALVDFTNDVTNAQRWICEQVMKPRIGSGGSIGMNLPNRIIIKSANNPFRPQPNCKHAEIDLRSYETSQVVRFGQCIYGRTDYRAYLEGDVLTEEEFESWKTRTKATYSAEE